MKNIKKILIYGGLALVLFFIINSIRIYHYSSKYYEEKSDVAIVLGAATHKDQLSPVFKERINHVIYLFNNQFISEIILTGGYGQGQNLADSEIAKKYIMDAGIPEINIHNETNSHYTYENLIESKRIMDSLNFSTALIVSDPLHMKRSIALAESYDIDCKPSPTQSSMYRSTWTKFKFLMSESFYYTLGKISFRF